eukprot:GILI01050149.1.p1 GENE.GILI01050149.1~~GILI01050149.1.p1  ORF type:complete len:164 (+),score=13.82 GILI01050149.1:88-579(+)
MGYFVKLVQSTFRIPKTQEALNALKEINQKWHSLKRGGSSSGDKWFSWMPADYDRTVRSVKAVFDLLGFETAETEDSVLLVDYDNKRGQEDLFLAAIASLVAEGSFVDWRGEDDEEFRHLVKNGKLWMQTKANGEWEEPLPFTFTMYCFEGDFQVKVVDPYTL